MPIEYVFDNLEDGGLYDELPVPCELLVRADKVDTYDKRNNQGSFGYEFQFVADGNDDDEELKKFNGLRFYYWLPLTPKAEWKTKEIILAFPDTVPEKGEDGKIRFSWDWNEGDSVAESFLGKSCVGEIDYDWEIRQHLNNGGTLLDWEGDWEPRKKLQRITRIVLPPTPEEIAEKEELSESISFS